jgi:hypothetical protein
VPVGQPSPLGVIAARFSGRTTRRRALAASGPAFPMPRFMEKDLPATGCGVPGAIASETSMSALAEAATVAAGVADAAETANTNASATRAETAPTDCGLIPAPGSDLRRMRRTSTSCRNYAVFKRTLQLHSICDKRFWIKYEKAAMGWLERSLTEGVAAPAARRGAYGEPRKA